MRSFYKEIEVELDDNDIEFFLKNMKDEELRQLGYIRTSTKINLDDIKRDFVEFCKIYKYEPLSHHSILIERIKKVLDI